MPKPSSPAFYWSRGLWWMACLKLLRPRNQGPKTALVNPHLLAALLKSPLSLLNTNPFTCSNLRQLKEANHRIHSLHPLLDRGRVQGNPLHFFQKLLNPSHIPPHYNTIQTTMSRLNKEFLTHSLPSLYRQVTEPPQKFLKFIANKGFTDRSVSRSPPY